MVLRKLSQTLRISLALMVATFSSGLLQPAVAYASHKPTHVPASVCEDSPELTADTSGWVKYDGLSSTTFEVPQVSGFTVTEICYKSSTSVVYPEVSTTVTSTVTNVNNEVQNLSHVSVFYTKVQSSVAASITADDVCLGQGALITVNNTGNTDFTFNLLAGGQATKYSGQTLVAGTSVDLEFTAAEVQTFPVGTYVIAVQSGSDILATTNVSVKDCTQAVIAASVTAADICVGDGASVTVTNTGTGTLTFDLVAENITAESGITLQAGVSQTFTYSAEEVANVISIAGTLEINVVSNEDVVGSGTLTLKDCRVSAATVTAADICLGQGALITVKNTGGTALTFDLLVNNQDTKYQGQTLAIGASVNLTFTAEEVSNKGVGSYEVSVQSGETILSSTNVEVSNCDDESVTLCHATGSKKNPFVRITVSAEGAFKGHLGEKHQSGEDIIPPFTYEGEIYFQNFVEGMVLTEECDVAEVVIPADVEFLNPTCVNLSGRVVITPTEGITYKVGNTVVTGTISYPAGTTVTVTAHVTDESYVIDEKTMTTWTRTFAAAPTNCLLGTTDVCPNIAGTQTMIPLGYMQNSETGDCFIPGRGGVTPPTPVLGAATAAVLPAVLPSTGGIDSPFMILVASMLAFGATYFLQGKRLLGRREAIEA